ncbi:MAG TPA: hypothetical protein DIS73_05535 [Planctomycetia bacterium]|nr:hypothetical protein [Planctomycetia bacterium]
MDEMEDAIDRVIAGPERKSRVLNVEEKRTVAYHESGHTLVRPYCRTRTRCIRCT